jgi:hypothetical protein
MPRVTRWLLVCLACAAPAAAQSTDPIGPFVVDVRGVFARHKVEPDIAKNLDVEPGNLPVRSLGLVAGAHVYPWRSQRIALGLGGTVILAGGSRALDIEASDGTVTKSPDVRRHFSTISPEVSINFGHRNGWSYISGGMFGRSKLYVDREDAPAADPPSRKTLNYGGGARWFTSDHLAFSVDFRWYSVAEQVPTATVVGQPRTTLLVLSGGVSFK